MSINLNAKIFQCLCLSPEILLFFIFWQLSYQQIHVRIGLEKSVCSSTNFISPNDGREIILCFSKWKNSFLAEPNFNYSSWRVISCFKSNEKLVNFQLFSLRLTVTEQVGILRESFFLLLSIIKVIFLLLIDYSLHWILMLINHHARLQFYFGRMWS